VVEILEILNAAAAQAGREELASQLQRAAWEQQALQDQVSALQSQANTLTLFVYLLFAATAALLLWNMSLSFDAWRREKRLRKIEKALDKRAANDHDTVAA